MKRCCLQKESKESALKSMVLHLKEKLYSLGQMMKCNRNDGNFFKNLLLTIKEKMPIYCEIINFKKNLL